MFHFQPKPAATVPASHAFAFWTTSFVLFIGISPCATSNQSFQKLSVEIVPKFYKPLKRFFLLYHIASGSASNFGANF